MSRADRWAVVAVALVLGGCMRIYPDPELPDVVIEWYPPFDCAEGGERVVVSLSEVDSAVEVGTAAVSCQDAGVRFDDVARVRHHLAVQIEDTEAVVVGNYETEIDLRDGLSERVFAFFNRRGLGDFRVAWTFDMGASCESLSARFIVVAASIPDGPQAFTWSVPCEAAALMDSIPILGTFTLSARALSADGVVATSPESAPFTLVPRMTIDLGTLTLSPCGTACPRPVQR